MNNVDTDKFDKRKEYTNGRNLSEKHWNSGKTLTKICWNQLVKEAKFQLLVNLTGYNLHQQ